MAKDDIKKEREDDNLEQYGVWVKTGSDGIEEIEPETIDIEDEIESHQLYITEEEEDLLNELHTNEEDDIEDFTFDSLDDENIDLNSLLEDDLDDDLDFSDVTSIEDTIEDSLPDFDTLDSDYPHPLEDAVDKLEAQTELLAESSRQLDILEKIESELFTIRNEIKDLKEEIGTIRMAPKKEGEEEKSDEQAAGFFDDSDLDETIALTGDELDNILDNTLDNGVTEEEQPEEEELLLQPEDTLPENEYQDEIELLSDTPLENILEIPEEDPALSVLTNMEDESFEIPEDEDSEGDTLELTIDDQGELEEEEINLDNLLEDDDISFEEISTEDILDESEAIEISNEVNADDLMSIDEVETSDDVEEIDIEDMVEASPDDDLVIEEVDLDDLEIDISDFTDDDEEELTEETSPEVAAEPSEAEELDETIFDEGEEVSFDDIDGDIVFEDENFLSETDEIESVDLSEFTTESDEFEDVDALDDIELDEIALDRIDKEDSIAESVAPLSDLEEKDDSLDFEEASLDDFMVEDEAPLDFPDEENAEFPLPPLGADDDTLIDISNDEDLEDILETEEDETPSVEELVIDDEEIPVEDFVIEEMEIPEEEELVIEEVDFPEEEEIVTEEVDFPEEEEIVIEEVDFPEEEELVIENDEIPAETGEEDDFLDLDLDLDLDLNDDDTMVLEEPDSTPEVASPTEDSFENISIEIEDEPMDEIDLSSDEISTAPLEDRSIAEENIDEIFDDLSLSDDLGEFGEEPVETIQEEEMSNLEEPSIEELEEEEEENTTTLSDIMGLKDSGELDALPYDLKEEIKEVLTYMDQLLEALPEDKIQEFARSEHFDVYKKIFTELGIAK
jgi:pilus assembly protein FimV